VLIAADGSREEVHAAILQALHVRGLLAG